MIVPSIDGSDPTPPLDRSTPSVLVVADADRDRLESVLANTDSLSVRSSDGLPPEGVEIPDVDCLVCRVPFADHEPTDIVDRVRTRHEQLPIVLVSSTDEAADIREAVASIQWIDVVPEAEAGQLQHRLTRLLERRRLSALSKRSLAGVELAGDAIGIVDPDGHIELVNRSFAVLFGADRETLVGRPWEALFDAETVDHLETKAIPTVADGWRWSGTCTAHRDDGDTVTARVALDGLEDGSLVFVVDES
ncbi:PAS domain-containing protein [Halobiforma nitratireducens]|uniref:PAS sensor protein n=1 Tax=Halobiforma nitratireducens JCM 10879 TaxID=1227454 RepID=M0LA51_9EURY|nr:PAS domain-containing protein [Halobiforma nitratireducens]EMA30451.1 PAS sensor protein [Halobiforma nitratireducens JCM 10879]